MSAWRILFYKGQDDSGMDLLMDNDIVVAIGPFSHVELVGISLYAAHDPFQLGSWARIAKFLDSYWVVADNLYVRNLGLTPGDKFHTMSWRHTVDKPEVDKPIRIGS